MRGFGAFFGKELSETVHTWRIWVLPAFILFAALSSPIITYLMPTLADRLGSTQMRQVCTVSLSSLPKNAPKPLIRVRRPPVQRRRLQGSARRSRGGAARAPDARPARAARAAPPRERRAEP